MPPFHTNPVFFFAETVNGFDDVAGFCSVPIGPGSGVGLGVGAGSTKFPFLSATRTFIWRFPLPPCWIVSRTSFPRSLIGIVNL